MHNGHTRPPDSIREAFKQWRIRSASQIDANLDVIDPYIADPAKVSQIPDLKLPGHAADTLINDFCKDTTLPTCTIVQSPSEAAFEINALPGLQVFPSLLTPHLQIALLHKLLHRDLSDPVHRTNLHLHHHVQYPETDQAVSSSFFSADRNTVLEPKDATVHKPITYQQMLESKLRWITLGAQYDWTKKAYPDEAPPAFPPDIAALLKLLFPTMDAQTAIVNFYGPGDTLSVHRDVSEECDRPLVSISIGCDGIFLIGNEDGSTVVPVRLRSGDAILMSSASRYAWHGVPKVLADTCPPWLQDWPDIPSDGQYQQWREWIRNKRINFNVRQMTETTPTTSRE